MPESRSDFLNELLYRGKRDLDTLSTLLRRLSQSQTPQSLPSHTQTMTAEAPDPKTFGSWEEAFQYPVPAVRGMERQLRRDIDSNREKLRTLVGYGNTPGFFGFQYGPMTVVNY